MRSRPCPSWEVFKLLAIDNWLSAVVQLFDHTLRALLREAFFSVLLEVLVFLVAFGLIASMLRAGRKV